MVEQDEKCTFKAPSGSKWNELNLTARAIYIVISANVNFKDHKCYCLSREKIANLVGIKNPDDVSKYTKQLSEAGFISKEIKWVNVDDKRCIYEVLVKDNYTLVKNNIIKSGLSGKAMALFCTIAAHRYQHSHQVITTYKECGVSRQTFSKYISELVEAGVIELDGSAFIFNRFVKCEDYRTNEKLQEILKMDEDSREYKQAMWAIQHPKRIHNIDAYIDSIWSGVKRHK